MNEGPKCDKETIKILEANIDGNLFDIGHSNFLLDTFPVERETKVKINSRDFKIKSFCTVKETVNKNNRQPTELEKIFANGIADKGLVSKIHNELIKLHPPQRIQLRNGQKT